MSRSGCTDANDPNPRQGTDHMTTELINELRSAAATLRDPQPFGRALASDVAAAELLERAAEALSGPLAPSTGLSLRFGLGAWIVTTGAHAEDPCVFVDLASVPGAAGDRAPNVEGGTTPMVRLLFPSKAQAQLVADALVGASTVTGKAALLAEKWRRDRHPDPHTDPWTLGYLRAKQECADDVEQLGTEEDLNQLHELAQQWARKNPNWVAQVLTGESWQQWRADNPGQVAAMAAAAQAAAADVPHAVDLGPGLRAIVNERRRQVGEEGMTPEADRRYRYGELARAALAYLQLAAMDLEAGGRAHIATAAPPACWPWSRTWWKPRDARRDLVRAGALIAAQLDALDSQQESSDAQ